MILKAKSMRYHLCKILHCSPTFYEFTQPLTYSRNDENVTYDVLVRRCVPEKDRISYRFRQKKISNTTDTPFV